MNLDFLNSNTKQSFTHDFLKTSTNAKETSELVSPNLKKPEIGKLFGFPETNLAPESLFDPTNQSSNFEQLFNSQTKGIDLKELLKPPLEMASLADARISQKNPSDIQSMFESKQNFSENSELVSLNGPNNPGEMFKKGSQVDVMDIFKGSLGPPEFKDMFGLNTSQNLEDYLKSGNKVGDLLEQKPNLTSVGNLGPSINGIPPNGDARKGISRGSLHAKHETASLTKSTSMLNDASSFSLSDKTAQKNTGPGLYANYLGQKVTSGTNVSIEKKCRERVTDSDAHSEGEPR